MADRPILFSGPMVRALLAGTKTQTRRTIKPRGHASLFDGSWADSYVLDPGNKDWRERDLRIAVGDRLWVKETSRITSWGEDGEVWMTYAADDAKSGLLHARDEDFLEKLCARVERAGAKTGPDGLYADIPPSALVKPSIFMPRWASRLTLTVTDVRVERLQDISEPDAWAEGCAKGEPDDVGGFFPAEEPDPSGIGYRGWDNARDWYADLWDHINGPGSWDANPWVACYSFRVHHGNIDQIGGDA